MPGWQGGKGYVISLFIAQINAMSVKNRIKLMISFLNCDCVSFSLLFRMSRMMAILSLGGMYPGRGSMGQEKLPDSEYVLYSGCFFCILPTFVLFVVFLVRCE